ncbi:MAG: dihydrolipoyl dehydrogenase family protein, partial [Verrucomicrobiota bacterium]
MSDSKYDLIVIGAGPGGYVCAIRAAQLGLKTALVEKSPHLGGTCLNVGCIPSKALLHSSHLFHAAAHGEHHGIVAKEVRLDLGAMMQRKDAVVDQLRKGVTGLIKQRGITVHAGTAKLLGDGQVTVATDKSNETLEAEHIVIATGSVPVQLPFLEFDGESVVSSDDAIAFDKVPESLVVVGAGAIGLELGSVWARLGSKVTMVEFLPQIGGLVDDDVAKQAARIFKKQGLAIDTETKVTGAEKKAGKVHLTAEKKGKKVTYEADKVLVAVGRR